MRFQCKSIEDEWEGIICNLTQQSNVYEFWIKIDQALWLCLVLHHEADLPVFLISKSVVI